MNYKRIYFNIIRNRLNNPLPKKVYGENHHIIPRSFGGSNRKSNLVRLTAREHYLAHFLLYKIFKQRINTIFSNSAKENSRYKKMALAFQMMLNVSSDNQQRHYGLINSKVFEQLRIDCAIASSDLNKKYSPEYVKELFDFYIKHNITEKTFQKLNNHFNTNFKHETFKKKIYSYGFKIKANRKRVNTQKYSPEYVKELFNFYINNGITQKTITKLNIYFGTEFKHTALFNLFHRNGFYLSDFKKV